MRLISLAKDPQEAVRAAALAVRNGQLVIFPTETVYGLFFTEKSREKAYALKKRAPEKPCAYHVGSFGTLYALAGEQSGDVVRTLEEKLPGPYTFLLPKGKEKIGFRFPGHKEACAFLEEASEPVFGTSANLSGEKAPVTVADTKALWDQVEVVVDGGRTRGAASDIIDLTGDSPKILKRT